MFCAGDQAVYGGSGVWRIESAVPLPGGQRE